MGGRGAVELWRVTRAGRANGHLSGQTQGSAGRRRKGAGRCAEPPGLCLLGPGGQVPLSALLRSSHCPCRLAFYSQDLLSIPQKFPQLNVYVYIFVCM